MWRILFLLLVVLGGLALTLALVLGIGIAKVAMVQQEDAAPDAPAVAPAPITGPAASATRPADVPATGPATPTTRPTGLAAAAVRQVPERPTPPAAPPPPPGPKIVVAKNPVNRPRPFVPGTIVLRGADAKLNGKLLRKNPPDGDLTNWARTDDYATWVFTPPPGRYHVDLTRATEAGGGGEFGVHLNAGDRKSDPAFVARADPTGGPEAFRTERVAQVDLEGGRTTLSVRPRGKLAGPLMRLRQIELVPVEPPAGAGGVARRPAAPGVVDDDGPPAVTGLTLVDARDGQPIGTLTNNMALDLSTLPPVSVRAEVAGRVGSVQFYEDGKPEHPPESEPPFAIAGAKGGQYVPWRPVPGRHYITAVPFPEPGGGGHPGHKHVVQLVVRSSATPVVLRAADAKLHGDGILLEGEQDRRNIGAWTDAEAHAEWQAAVPSAGRYTVEMLVARDNRDGGRFVLRAGDAKLAGKLKGTGGWDAYQWVTAGTLKLSRGDARVSIKPEGSTGGRPLMNLREVRLVPAAEEDKGEDEGGEG